MKKYKHQFAIECIKKELCRIGGELFEQEFIKQGLNKQAELGNKEAQDMLGMQTFVEKLFSISEATNEKEEQFIELCKSLCFLINDKNE